MWEILRILPKNVNKYLFDNIIIQEMIKKFEKVQAVKKIAKNIF